MTNFSKRFLHARTRQKKDVPGFPVIIPIALYHGKTSWRVGLNFRDLFDSSEELVSFIPDFQYLLWDASQYSDEEIKGKVVLRVALLLLKYIFREDLRENFPDIGGKIMPTIADLLREEGIQQGILQSAREAVIDILELRFEVVPRVNSK